MGWRMVLLFKDGVNGRSPGKALNGLRVIDIDSNKPIGFIRSFQRNLLLLVPLVGEIAVFFTMNLGIRPFDRWANCKVILEEEGTESV